jgi:hypothetical protein
MSVHDSPLGLTARRGRKFTRWATSCCGSSGGSGSRITPQEIVTPRCRILSPFSPFAATVPIAIRPPSFGVLCP